MAMTRADIRAYVQGLLQQQPPLSRAEIITAVAEKWLDDRGDSLTAGTETQTQTPNHVLRLRRVAGGDIPVVWSVLHPVPDTAATDPANLTTCPFNRVGTDGVVGLPDHRGYFLITLSADLTQIIVGAEVNP
jgi:hypothetical protein